MHSSEELKRAYEALKNEIYNELRFTLQFSLSHHFLLQNQITDLPPQFDQLRKQMIEAFWGMIYLRLLLFFEDGACSLLRFIRYAYDLKVIDAAKRDALLKEFENLRDANEIRKAETIRSKLIAHSDKKRPEDTKMFVSPIIESIERIFVSAGGKNLDTTELEKKMGGTWSLLFDLLRYGMEFLPQDWRDHLPSSTPSPSSSTEV